MTTPPPGGYDPAQPYGQHAPYGQPYPPQHPHQHPHQYPYAYPVRLPTNAFAIASLVLGLLWIDALGSVLALIFGYVALGQIRSRPEGGRGLAIAGIVLGWVGVGVTLFIMLFVVAVFSRG